MCGRFGIHCGMGIVQRIASYESREEEKKEAAVYYLYPRVRAALLNSSQNFLHW